MSGGKHNTVFFAPSAPPQMSATPFRMGTELSLSARVAALEETVWNLAQYSMQVAEVTNGARRGKISPCNEITLRANETTTTLTSEDISANSHIFMFPLSANAASVIASTYISSMTNGQAVITHPSDANTDKTFDYVILG